MPSDGMKDLMEKSKEKFRSIFNPQDPQKKQNALPPKAHFSIWYFLIVFLLFTFVQQYFLSQKVETIPYSQFKQYLADGTVTKLTIGPDNISGTLKGKEKKPDQAFTTIRVNDPDLVKDLDEHKVNYSGLYREQIPERSSFLGPPYRYFFYHLAVRYEKDGAGYGGHVFQQE